jgi:hypothetical protein
LKIKLAAHQTTRRSDIMQLPKPPREKSLSRSLSREERTPNGHFWPITAINAGNTGLKAT